MFVFLVRRVYEHIEKRKIGKMEKGKKEKRAPGTGHRGFVFGRAASRSNSESIRGASNKLVVESTISSQEELSNITRLADAESRKGGKGNKKGTAEFNHGRFQRQRKGVYELGQYALSSAIAASKIRKTARKGKMKCYFATIK